MMIGEVNGSQLHPARGRADLRGFLHERWREDFVTHG